MLAKNWIKKAIIALQNLMTGSWIWVVQLVANGKHSKLYLQNKNQSKLDRSKSLDDFY